MESGVTVQLAIGCCMGKKGGRRCKKGEEGVRMGKNVKEC